MAPRVISAPIYQGFVLALLLPLLGSLPLSSRLSLISSQPALAQSPPSPQDLRGQIQELSRKAGRQLSEGKYGQAIALYEQALALARKTNQPEIFVPSALFDLGFAHFQAGNQRQAIAYYEQSLAASSPQSLPSQPLILAHLGMVYLNSADYSRALSYAQQGLADADPDDVMTVGTLKALQGEALFKTGKIKSAEPVLREAIKTLESVRTIYFGSTLNEPGNLSAILFEQQIAVGRTLQQVLVAQNKPESALEIAEEMRAKILAELLAVQLTPGQQRTATQRQQAEILQFEQRNQAVTQQFAQKLEQLGIQPDQVQNLPPEVLQQIFQPILEQNTAQKPPVQPQNPPGETWFANLDPVEFEAILQPQTFAPLSIQEIKQVAKQQQATLVHYSLITNSSFGQQSDGQAQQLLIWTIQPGGAIAFKAVDISALKTNLSDLVSDSRAAIGVQARGLQFQEDPAVVSQVAGSQGKSPRLQALYQLLIQPIADQLPQDPNQRVIFIPQGALFMVPFAALQDSSGKYLLENHTISTAPAIQVLVETQKQRQRIQQSGLQNILVVGNPTMPNVGTPPRQLTALPGAEQEAKAIAQLFNTKAITGDQATKAVVVSQMLQARIIHLATHGLLDRIPPIPGAIALNLARGAGRGIPGAIALAPMGQDDGWLTANELLNLKLQAELVVLSACDTGAGEITGDGVLGLSRSLLIAGTPSVIVSLWKVPDDPTALLMTEFYQIFKQNPNKAQALRQAMLKTMQVYPDPKDWAAFVLIGEAE